MCRLQHGDSVQNRKALHTQSDRITPVYMGGGIIWHGEVSIGIRFGGDVDRGFTGLFCSSIGYDCQLLYSNFKSISKAFDVATKMDNPLTEADDKILNCSSDFYKGSLWVFGFIRALLKYCCEERAGARGMLRFEEKVSLHADKYTVSEVTAVREQLKADGKILPFFVLDEMTSSTGKNMAIFQRNVFRRCGLVVIAMGTDAKMTNLIRSGGSFKRTHAWLTIFPRFPPMQPIEFTDTETQAAWKKIQDQYSILKVIVEKSRGRFSCLFAKSVAEYARSNAVSNLCDLLDTAFDKVFRWTLKGKNFLNTEYDPEAQMMAISYANTHPGSRATSCTSDDVVILAEERDDHEGPSLKRRNIGVGGVCMHSHFANMMDEHPSDIYASDDGLELANGAAWTPRCRFPTAEEDLLLYLAVLGGKNSAFYDGNVTRSVVFVFSTYWRAQRSCSIENTNIWRNEHKLYEEMVAHVVFCASRRNGVRGIRFEDFPPCVLQEFLVETDKKLKQKPMKIGTEVKTIRDLVDGHNGLSKLLDTTVPFSAPPNAQWPHYILDTRGNGCNLGHLHVVRPKNEERCDLCVYMRVNGGQSHCHSNFSV